MSRGLSESLALQVAAELTNKDALEAHARDELGITETLRARPLQASFASALSFAVGAAVPILATVFAPVSYVTAVSFGTAIVTLVLLGAVSAYVGGAPILRAATRVAFWGILAMAFTAILGSLFGTTV
jgi:Uncharacterized membrane protein